MPDEFVLAMSEVVLRLPSSAGPVEILRGASLSVAAGERVAVVGASGSGKSSLVAVAAGLERPTGGSVRLLGADLSALDEDGRAALRRGRVALVFQNFHLLPNMTALENVAAPLEIDGRRGAASSARDWLGRVGLGARAGHYPHQLSGGEQQRVAIARALAVGPRLLFADEPTGNLDGETAERIASLMLALTVESGAALVLVTHDRRLASRLDRVVAMEGGRLVAAA
jgi:putative ABC transport system ATP-binding protein